MRTEEVLGTYGGESLAQARGKNITVGMAMGVFKRKLSYPLPARKERQGDKKKARGEI